MDHNMTIEYTNSDDGIWVECSCKESCGLGFFPTVEDVAYIAEVHRAAVR